MECGAAEHRPANRSELQRSLYNAALDPRPGDSRALKVQPPQLNVAFQQDVGSAELMAQAGLSQPDPTGLLACPQPCNVRYAAAYSFHGPELTR